MGFVAQPDDPKRHDSVWGSSANERTGLPNCGNDHRSSSMCSIPVTLTYRRYRACHLICLRIGAAARCGSISCHNTELLHPSAPTSKRHAKAGSVCTTVFKDLGARDVEPSRLHPQLTNL